MKEITVKYLLTDEEVERLEKITEEYNKSGMNISKEKEFEYIMVTGCRKDIDNKFKYYEWKLGLNKNLVCNYISYPIKNTMKLQSLFSMRIYDLLKATQKGDGEWIFRLANFKKWICCEDYQETFETEVLEAAVKEINENTDLNITYKLYNQYLKFEEII